MFDSVLVMFDDVPVLFVANALGTTAFALSGGLAGVRAGLDVFGVCVVAAVVGLAGGVMRDVLIGIPPQTFRDWRYLAIVVAAGIAVSLVHPFLARMQRPVDVLDAAGLAVFCISGALTALEHRVGASEAVVLGMVTGVGGGIVRDLLVDEIPVVLRSELYAIPALIGASIYVIPQSLGHSSVAWAAAGAVTCFVVRLVGMHFRLDAPRPVAMPRPSGNEHISPD
ncbi:MAG: hypothetical protein JWN41_69 [Thermoleophilia bacterium]|nr:hypothetical protein [Thermoleophilia bacterium]